MLDTLLNFIIDPLFRRSVIIGVFLLVRMTERLPTTKYFQLLIIRLTKYTFIVFAFHEFTLIFAIKK